MSNCRRRCAALQIFAARSVGEQLAFETIEPSDLSRLSISLIDYVQRIYAVHGIEAAAVTGDVELTKYALSRLRDVRQAFTAVYRVIENDAASLLPLFFLFGCDQADEMNGYLRRACSFKAHACVKFLLSCTNFDHNTKLSGLEIACINNDLSTVMLLTHGSDASELLRSKNVLMESAASGSSDIVEYLINHGASIHVDDDVALRYSAVAQHVDVVQLLLKRGANVHASSDYALRYAAQRSSLEIVKVLLAAGADVTANNHEALRNASALGQLSTVSAILQDQRADVHAHDDAALDLACSNGHYDVVSVLLEHGANVHARRERALISAVRHSYIDIVDLLVSHGANIHVDDESPLVIAMTEGTEEMLRKLISRGADISVLDRISRKQHS